MAATRSRPRRLALLKNQFQSKNMDLDTPNGWPKHGLQDDGTWVAYTFHPGSNRISSCVTYTDYTAFLLKRRGGNKDRLLVRIYLAQGKDPKDYTAVIAHLKAHEGRKWTFWYIHDFYDTNKLLPPEHRYRGYNPTK
jgi:hypothetical protein